MTRVNGDAFTPQVFERLTRARTAGDAITSAQPIVDELLRRVNRSMWASRLSVMRTQFGLNGGDAFLTTGNYIHGDPGNWYAFHRNGRWEPQFNIGVFGHRPGRPGYIRIGLGAALGLASADPEREAGLPRLRSFVGNFQWLARSDQRGLMGAALQVGRPLVECVGAAPDTALTQKICSWFGSLDATVVSWAFVGRILTLDVSVGVTMRSGPSRLRASRRQGRPRCRPRGRRPAGGNRHVSGPVDAGRSGIY